MTYKADELIAAQDCPCDACTGGITLDGVQQRHLPLRFDKYRAGGFYERVVANKQKRGSDGRFAPLVTDVPNPALRWVAPMLIARIFGAKGKYMLHCPDCTRYFMYRIEYLEHYEDSHLASAKRKQYLATKVGSK